MRTSILDKAPGKELIPTILEDKSFDVFYEFYKTRVDWHSYPLIHDRHITYGLFSDLIDNVPEEKDDLFKFIDFSIKITEEESDKRFLNAIYLLSRFCTKAKWIIKPTQTQLNSIIDLTPRVKRLSFLSNITSFWQQILEFIYQGKPINKLENTVNSNDYLNVVDLNFPSIDHNTSKSCPLSSSELQKEVEDLVGEYHPPVFVRSAIIDSDRYWVWTYRNIKGNYNNWYITVKQDKDLKVVVDRHRMGGEMRNDPETLLLYYHYNS